MLERGLKLEQEAVQLAARAWRAGPLAKTSFPRQ
jgi:hypothetical protein